MCGRTACTLAPDDIVTACTYKDERGQRKRPVWKDPPGGQKYWQSCNIAPTSHTPVLVQSDFDGTKTGSASDRTVIPMKWGLTPSWHRGDPYKVSYETNNCRSEGMLEKKTYKIPMQKGFRCVILADGYFEWKTTQEGKQPYFFYFPQPNGMSYPGETEAVKLASETVKTELASETVKTELASETVKTELASETVKTELASETVKTELVTDTEKTVNREMKLNKTTNDMARSRGVNHDVLLCDLRREGHSDGEKRETFPIQVKQEADEKKSPRRCDKNADVDTCHVENLGKEIGDDTNVKELTQHNSEGSEAVPVKGETMGEDVPEWTGQRLLTMAGIYDVWTPPDGSPPLYSYSIITVPASTDIDWCHHRMPAILSTEKDIRDWLDSANIKATEAASLISQHKGLMFHPVSKDMNNSRYKSPDCIKPVELGKPKVSHSSMMMMNWLKTGSPAKKIKAESSQ